MTEIALVTLTSLVDDKYCSEFPDSLRDVWPLLLAHQASIRGLHFVVDRTASRFTLRRLGLPLWDRNRSADVYPLPSLSDLTEEQLEAVQYSSFSAGHLTILFVTDYDSDLMRAFVKLWPTVTFQTSCDWDALGLKSQTISAFAEFLESHVDRSCVISFAHDAEPVYVFGREDHLRLLLKGRDS